MKNTLLILTASAAIGYAGPDKEKPVSHLPEKGLGEVIVNRLDITTFGNSLWARRYPGQRHFADLGMKPVSVTDQFIDLSDDEWTFTIRVLERRDQNRDGIEDIALLVSDVSKIGTYATSYPLLVTRFSADGDLIALACGASEPEKEPPPPPPPAADSPEGIVAALYKAHASGSSPFFPKTDRKRVEQTFTAAMAALICEEANHPAGESGAISADPLIDARDGEPAGLSFAADKPHGGRVLVTASFSLAGKARRIRFRMEEEAGVWKVADILGNDFTSLRETLEGARGQLAPQSP